MDKFWKKKEILWEQGNRKIFQYNRLGFIESHEQQPLADL